MSTMLHLDSAAHDDPASISRRLSAQFAEEWRAANSGSCYEYRDLVADRINAISSAYCSLGRRVEQLGIGGRAGVAACCRNPSEEREWSETEGLVDQLTRADILLLGVPMYNFAIPAALKAWIDRVTFPHCLRDLDGTSRIAHLDVVAISPRGGSYRSGSATHHLDFVSPYLRAYFTRYGVDGERIHIITADYALAPLVGAQTSRLEEADASLRAARMRVARLVKTLSTGRTSLSGRAFNVD